MPDNYAPREHDRVVVTLRGKVTDVIADGHAAVLLTDDGCTVYLPITEGQLDPAVTWSTVESPMPAWCEGDAVMGAVSGLVYVRDGDDRWCGVNLPPNEFGILTDAYVTKRVDEGALAALRRGGKPVERAA